MTPLSDDKIFVLERMTSVAERQNSFTFAKSNLEARWENHLMSPTDRAETGATRREHYCRIEDI